MNENEKIAEFCEELKQALSQVTNISNVDFQIVDVVKNNLQFKGLHCLPANTRMGVNLPIGIALDEVERGNVPKNLAIEKLVEIYQAGIEQMKNSDEFVRLVKDFNFVRESIYPVLTSNKNAEMCKDLVSRPYLDMFIYYQIRKEAGSESYTAPITKSLAICWDVSEQILYEYAMDNLRNEQKKIIPIAEVVAEMAAQRCYEETRDEKLADIVGNQVYTIAKGMEKNGPKMYVATNTRHEDGANVMLDDFSLRELSMKLGGSYYILPSSTEEIIAMEDTSTEDEPFDVEEAKNMVVNINANEVADIEVLTDSVYYYNSITRQVSIAAHNQ